MATPAVCFLLIEYFRPKHEELFLAWSDPKWALEEEVYLLVSEFAGRNLTAVPAQELEMALLHRVGLLHAVNLAIRQAICSSGPLDHWLHVASATYERKSTVRRVPNPLASLKPHFVLIPSRRG
uniref:Uncharacterized protein n=1 Tax=Melanopsichium pennsylvanicum 4 TaxID=1398559 RepID=A0A077QTM1_9BASI|nr:uncharacterized protein BN887_06102 [Melanopsichium pennsylvanicum 4]